MRLVLLAVVARAGSCGEPAASVDDPCAPLPPLAAGEPVEDRLFVPNGFTSVGLAIAEEHAPLGPGTYVDVVVEPRSLPSGERPPARTIARDRLLDHAGGGRAWVLTEEAGAELLRGAAAAGTVSLLPSDGRAGLGCDPGIRDYRRAIVALVEGHPTIATPAGPPERLVEVRVPAAQEAGFVEPATFVDVVRPGVGVVARGVLFERASWPGTTPEVALVADPAAAAAVRDAAARGAITFAPATEGTGLTGDGEVLAWARRLRW